MCHGSRARNNDRSSIPAKAVLEDHVEHEDERVEGRDDQSGLQGVGLSEREREDGELRDLSKAVS